MQLNYCLHHGALSMFSRVRRVNMPSPAKNYYANDCWTPAVNGPGKLAFSGQVAADIYCALQLSATPLNSCWSGRTIRKINSQSLGRYEVVVGLLLAPHTP